MENKSALLKQMEMFITKFNELKIMLETEDIEGHDAPFFRTQGCVR